MLCSALKVPGLTGTNIKMRGEFVVRFQPHGLVAVEAATVLLLKSLRTRFTEGFSFGHV